MTPNPVATILSVQSGETTIHMLDRLYKPTGTRKGVIVTHGANVTATAFLQGGPYWQPVAYAANGGYPCLCVDEGGSATFGNDTSIAAMNADKGVIQALPSLAKPGGVFVYGGSMGALTALAWARANIANVLGLFLTIPALDLNDIYVNNKGGLQAEIATAYGIVSPAAIPNLALHSPAAFSSADKAVLATVPIKLWAADDDPIASNTAAATAWAATVGPNVTVSSLGNTGHSAAGLDPLALVRWLDSEGGRS